MKQRTKLSVQRYKYSRLHETTPPCTVLSMTQEAKRIETDGQKVAEDLFYMKQYIGNACGTIGILHALGNNTDKLEIGMSCALDQK